MDLIGPHTLRGKDGTEIDFMFLTMIDQATSWFQIVEVLVTTDAVLLMDTKRHKGTKTHKQTKLPYFDKSLANISNLVNNTWFRCYPHCQNINYDNESKFKLHFKAPSESFGIKRKQSSFKNPTVDALLEQAHQVIALVLHTAEIDMATSVAPSDIDEFLTNAACVIYSTYPTVQKASPGCSTYPSLLTEIKLETTGTTKLTTTWNGKIIYFMIGIKQVTKYFLGKIESSAKVKVGMNVILGPSHQLIKMGLSGFKVKQNLKD